MSDAPSIGISGIGQIGIVVHDVPKATAFYRDVLGMPFLFDAPSLAFFQCGEVRLMLTLPSAPELDHPASPIYYRVDDIHGAHAMLRERGVEFERAPQAAHRTQHHELWLAFFRDPDGNLLALMSEVSLE